MIAETASGLKGPDLVQQDHTRPGARVVRGEDHDGPSSTPFQKTSISVISDRPIAANGARPGIMTSEGVAEVVGD